MMLRKGDHSPVYSIGTAHDNLVLVHLSSSMIDNTLEITNRISEWSVTTLCRYSDYSREFTKQKPLVQNQSLSRICNESGGMLDSNSLCACQDCAFVLFKLLGLYLTYIVVKLLLVLDCISQKNHAKLLDCDI